MKERQRRLRLVTPPAPQAGRPSSPRSRRTGQVLVRVVLGAAVGCALGGATALVGFGIAREIYWSYQPDAIRMSALGGAVVLAFPAALAIVRVYSTRGQWSSAGRTFTLFPGVAIGALAGVAALIVGWLLSLVLSLVGGAPLLGTSTQIVIGAAVLGAALALLDLRHSGRR